MTLGDATQGKRKATANEGEVAAQRRKKTTQRVDSGQWAVEGDRQANGKWKVTANERPNKGVEGREGTEWREQKVEDWTNGNRRK